MIILLDLNYTLVANNPARGTTPVRMEKRLAGEQYRQWLVELVRPHTVVLITARPESWMPRTLDRIEEQTGWRPQDACFAPQGWWKPNATRWFHAVPGSSTRRSPRSSTTCSSGRSRNTTRCGW